MITKLISEEYNTVLFTDIYPSAADLLADYKDNGIPITITDDSLNTLFYLLYAKYGNNPIANRDITQFKYKLFSIIFQYGSTWEKKLDIQKKLRELNEQELITGSKQIYNHAYNPGSSPSTGSLEELNYINDQNTSNNKKSKMEAYGTLWSLLRADVTSEFISRFKSLFKVFVRPENTLYYITENDDSEQEE